MTDSIQDPTQIERADVYKGGELAAHLTRTDEGVEFRYIRDWVDRGGRPVAMTLPVTNDPVVTAGGAVPAYFAGLLPEGRRLSALRSAVKTSADDELSLLLAIGTDPIGDVQVMAEGTAPERAAPRVSVASFDDVRFADLLAQHPIVLDRVGIPGVQDKVSLAMLNLPVAMAGESFLLKLNPPEFPHLVDNESFFLERARRSRVQAVRARIVLDRDAVPGLVVTRFDRYADGGTLAVEDGCQVLGLHPEAKYRKSAEEILGALARSCAAPLPAALELLRQAVFAYLTGNGDAHAKNFSIVADSDGEWAPAPAYDLSSSHPYGDTTLALRMDGRNDGNLTGRRHVALGEAIGLTSRAAQRAVRETAAAADDWIDELGMLPFDRGVLDELKRVIVHRQRLLLDL